MGTEQYQVLLAHAGISVAAGYRDDLGADNKRPFVSISLKRDSFKMNYFLARPE